MQNPLQPPPPEAVSSFISSEAQNEAELIGPRESPLSTNQNIGDRYSGEVEYLIKTQFANSLQQNRRERIKYAKWTFWLTIGWIFIVLILVFLSGLKHKGEAILHLSDTVLITLITTTTLNVFGFFILVMQFLFNKEELAALGFLFNPNIKPIDNASSGT